LPTDKKKQDANHEQKDGVPMFPLIPFFSIPLFLIPLFIKFVHASSICL